MLNRPTPRGGPIPCESSFFLPGDTWPGPAQLVAANALGMPLLQRCKAAIVQMTAVNDVAANFAACAAHVREARDRGCAIVFLPENFSFMGSRPGEAQTVAEPLDGPTMRRYLDLARETGLWLSLGGFQERGPDGDERIYNTHCIVDGEGRLVAKYRKIHLYDAPFVGLVESRQAISGDSLVTADSPAGRLGVSICYDLRFPELYQKLSFLHGAQVLLMPSAFAMKTGEAHWETLLRCRAIETQCYVVAAAQVGQHNTDGNKRCSWGHAVAFDPWGKCIADLGDAPGLATFDIDPELIAETRRNMPMARHRRYGAAGAPLRPPPSALPPPPLHPPPSSPRLSDRHLRRRAACGAAVARRHGGRARRQHRVRLSLTGRAPSFLRVKWVSRDSEVGNGYGEREKGRRDGGPPGCGRESVSRHHGGACTRCAQLRTPRAAYVWENDAAARLPIHAAQTPLPDVTTTNEREGGVTHRFAPDACAYPARLARLLPVESTSLSRSTRKMSRSRASSVCCTAPPTEKSRASLAPPPEVVAHHGPPGSRHDDEVSPSRCRARCPSWRA